MPVYYVHIETTEIYKNWKCITEGARRSSLLVRVRKCLGSHRKLRPAGAEYELNDGWLGNMAAHSGFPYKPCRDFVTMSWRWRPTFTHCLKFVFYHWHIIELLLIESKSIVDYLLLGLVRNIQQSRSEECKVLKRKSSTSVKAAGLLLSLLEMTLPFGMLLLFLSFLMWLFKSFTAFTFEEELLLFWWTSMLTYSYLISWLKFFKFENNFKWN